jgi:hypothetical protein
MSAISSDYAQPVQVNGFTCKNCSDVDLANKHIDPAHPKSGPYGIDAASDPSQRNSAVTLSGSLAMLTAQAISPAAEAERASARLLQPGGRLDIAA